ncbi:TadE family type IV pilus minor pilin [Streptomyces sp. H27-D2]|uniref:TadE family type IV pilus minor pilin n=1 Tax=Streptomyces sp. H27-D2 TaxID=3046304 RepID=UPI002DBAB347|nr:TadE family type IV pilus minor pilin [Streptomyces sp. H27-D2]MEC4015004.1 TadE family type IV pilus minor pilin [Streptomyces sp. H27-D2]
MRSSEHGSERVGAGPGAAAGSRAADAASERAGFETVGSRTRGSADAGYVTAEAAVALPTLAVFAVLLIWGLMAAAAQIQCVDAARAGARAAARSEPASVAVAAARSAAPRGARVTVGREGDLVRVRVDAPTAGPGALSVRLSGEAVALAEETVSQEGGPVG